MDLTPSHSNLNAFLNWCLLVSTASAHKKMCETDLVKENSECSCSSLEGSPGTSFVETTKTLSLQQVGPLHQSINVRIRFR